MLSTSKLLSSLAFCIYFSSPFAFANESIDLSLFNDEIPVVLSATRLAQPQTEAPASITIIDRQMIKLSGAKEIPELFRLVPGMHLNYFRGNSPTVGYQGLNSEYPQGVQVIVDGRSMYNPIFGGVNWRTFPISIDEIERIEVVRGSNSTAFGSNAFQSVVSITTTHASQSNGFEVKTTVGERGYQRTYVRGGHSVSDLDFRLSASHTDNNGYKNNTNDSRQDIFNVRIDYQVTPHDSLQINASGTNTLIETANPDTEGFVPLTFDPTDPRRNVDESNFSLHGKWEHSTKNNQQLITQLSYARFNSKDKVTSNYTQAPFGSVVTNIDYTTAFDRWDFEFEHQLQANEKTRLTWGIALRSDRVYLPLWTGTTDKHDNSLQRVFSNIEWRPINDLIINAGASWEHSQLVGDDLAPRIAANYLITPKQSLRFIASHSFRSPVIVENNFDTDLTFETTNFGTLVAPVFQATKELNPETVDSFELGYHGLFFNNALTLDLKLFRNEYDHIIDNIDCADSPITCDDADTLFTSRTFDNLHHVNVNGYEAELNYKPDGQNLLHIGYAHNHANINVNVEKYLVKKIENIYSSIPQDVFNILVSHTFDNDLWASATYYYTSSIHNLDSGNALGPMRRLDLNAGKSFKVAEGQSIDLNFTLQLALDKNKDFLDEFNLDNRAFIEITYTYE